VGPRAGLDTEAREVGTVLNLFDEYQGNSVLLVCLL
jgi:hypothetical protein